MNYKCLYCDKEEEFEDPLEAFQAGWDVPPYFTIGPLCGDCPTTDYLKHLEGDADREFWEMS